MYWQLDKAPACGLVLQLRGYKPSKYAKGQPTKLRIFYFHKYYELSAEEFMSSFAWQVTVSRRYLFMCHFVLNMERIRPNVNMKVMDF
jgi:hypothetical protein